QHVLRGRNTNSGSSDSFASSNGMAAGAIMSSSLLPERPQLARERAVNDLRTPDARFRIEELERVLGRVTLGAELLDFCREKFPGEARPVFGRTTDAMPAVTAVHPALVKPPLRAVRR